MAGSILKAMEEVKKTWWQKFWNSPAFFLFVIIGIFVIYGLIFFIIPKMLPTGYIQVKPEEKPHLERQTLSSAAGPIEVIDLRSGTEFNRIILFPDGHHVVEGGYVNSLGEQRIRMIGRVEDP
jgi:hypothetical protein